MSQRLFKMHRALWLDPAGTPRSFETASQQHCCEAMTQALTNDCDQHPDDPFGCADCLVSYSPTFDEYGLIVHDGGASSVAIQFCPWCGHKLPENQRERWFDELESQGSATPLSGNIPSQFKSADWRRKKD